MTAILRKKVHGASTRGQVIDGAPDVGVAYQVFSDTVVEDVIVKNSPRGFKFHNGKNLTVRRCETENVKGDGIYLTKTTHVLLENNRIGAAPGEGADCCQFAYQNSDDNISSDIVIRGNLFLQSPASASNKGALVCDKTRKYLVEYNFIGGKNFSFSSIGDDAVVRSNIMRDGRMNDYSFGYGVADKADHAGHHIYDNWIENTNRGVSLSGFSDQELAFRKDIDIHDNVISQCDIAFFANRRWSGSFRRNIFLRCEQDIVLKGNGKATAGDIDGNYRNDGSFLNVTPPPLRFKPDGNASVASGEWTSEPDEIRIQWRNKGIDIPGANRPSIAVEPGMELSCVLLARKAQNWMLAIAETAYDDFTPRAWQEHKLPWQKRYLSI
ncbi:right-handed parallel beta-helix repeat-containing protein [Rhizobium leguminosarum]|uniref:Right-handed parallel beta-helix repeat-containing protein n=1 Tax=Rhizobium leguminosarum TaxID=384 RepID=A0A4V2IIN9_RHILE|nr:right-handed parallel beta-helix repeat-containing protein [Rhizobium leguminosarum]TAX70506.1 right-handed parallel beta-helix repeat-containing protein [Rhizobium leguminosarum]TAY15538.1 right-handed parallel beta-helix repeat-containing protein [Rhizobium leguminosarum]